MRHCDVGDGVGEERGGEELDGVRSGLLDGGCVVHVDVGDEGEDEHGVGGLVDNDGEGEGDVNALSELENRIDERSHEELLRNGHFYSLDIGKTVTVVSSNCDALKRRDGE